MSVVLDFANIAGTPLSFSIPTYEVVVDSEVPPFTVVASIARQNAGMDLDFAEPGTSPLSFALVSYEVMFDGQMTVFEPNIQVTSLMTLAGPFVSFELDAAFSEPVVFDGYVDSFELDSYIERELPPAVSIDVDSNIPTMVLDASLLDTMVIDVDVTSFDSDIELLSGFYSYIELDSTFVAIGEGSYTGDGWVEPNADIAIQMVYSAVCCDGGSVVIDPYPAPLITGPFNAYINGPFTEDGLGVDIRMSLYKRAINIPALGDAWLVNSSDGRGHSHSVLGIDRRD